MATVRTSRATEDIRKSINRRSTNAEKPDDKADVNERDELAEKWAALSELPARKRLRTSIMKVAVEDEDGKSQWEHKAVDVRSLDDNDRRAFIDQNFKVVEEDNEKFLVRIRERIDRAGVKLPKVEVRYENLKVEAKCHIGERALPTLLNSTKNIVEMFTSKFAISSEKKTTFTILNRVSGIIRPSRMTLLLGPPASGKTTLLRAVAGRLDPTLKVSGEVTYNGHNLDEFVPRKTASYISQTDAHTAELTVKETIAFSARCQGVGSSYDILSELEKKEKELGIYPEPDLDFFMKASAVEGVKSTLKTDYVIKILGLETCDNTIAGDEMQRGISGGEKKRLTTGEAIVGPTKILFMDEISNGLDSSTTFQIVKCLQQIAHHTDATVLMTLLQPSPETVELFDDIILLSEGQIVYQGPQEFVLEFFESCGFQCPERTGTADFLQEVTSRKDQEQYWVDKKSPYHYISISEFAEQFKRFHVGLHLENELSVPFDKSKSHKGALVFTKHTVSLLQLLRTSFSKEWLLVKRNAAVHIFQTVQLTLVAVIVSTVFLRTQLHSTNEEDAEVYIGAIIYSMIFNFFNGFSELPFTIIRLPVLYKHRDLLYYPPWIFTLPNFLLRCPMSLVESIVWVGVTYHFIGFSHQVSRFFKQMLLIFLIQQTAAGLFRLIAGLCRLMVISNSGGTLVLLFMIVVGGFILPRDEIRKWCIWGYWSSPISYAYNALSVNEMLSPRWMDKLAPDGRRLGIAVLENFSIFTNRNWYWIGAGALLGFSILFNVLFTISLAYLDPLGKPQAVLSDDTLMKMENHKDATKKASKIRKAGSVKAHLLKSLSMSIDKDVKETRDMVIQQSDSPSSSCSRSEQSLAMPTEAPSGVASKRVMALPFMSLSMSFDEVSYYVDMPPGIKEKGETECRLQLLKGVTGAFHPGVLTALMGVSGAGKTTLMDVLAGRKINGYIEGDIRISGYPKNQATFARISGYCEQNDIHSPQVTVMESLIYSAFLRLPKELTKEEKVKFVNEVMELVELGGLKDVIVGLPGVTGLSLEQRKRLTVAVELVANPSIIFMDEPTSGLDARAAAIVIRTVRNTVDTGRTVVCTIHQPSIHIFEAFDEVLLLKKGGQVVYFGPLGHQSKKIIEYFEAIPGVPKIKDKHNPATWMIEASSTATELQLGIDFAEYYKSSTLFEHNKALVSELQNPATGTSDLFFATKYSQSPFEQFKSCLWKQWLTYWRSPDYNLVRLFFSLVTALMFGSILWKIGRKRETSAALTVVIGAMSTAEMLVGFINCSTVLPIVSTERTVFYRERAAGMYSSLPYAIAQVVVEIPYVFIQALYYSAIVYSMMAFQWTAAKFLWFFFISFFTFLYYTYYGMMIVSVTPNQQAAAILSSAFYALFNLFSGFFIPKPKIPKWWIWYYWICPVAWTVYGIIVTQYGDLDDVIKVPGRPDQTIKFYVKDHFGYNLDFRGVVATMLVVFTISFALIFAYCIKKLNFQKR